MYLLPLCGQLVSTAPFRALLRAIPAWRGLGISFRFALTPPQSMRPPNFLCTTPGELFHQQPERILCSANKAPLRQTLGWPRTSGGSSDRFASYTYVNSNSSHAAQMNCEIMVEAEVLVGADWKTWSPSDSGTCSESVCSDVSSS